MKPLGAPDSSIEEAAEQTLQAFAVLDGEEICYEPAVGSVVSPIHRGVEGACFNVEAGDRSFFLKVRYPDMTMYFDENAVCLGAERASDLGVGAKLVESNIETGSYLFERLSDDWQWGKVDDFEDSEVLENTVAAKRVIHQGEVFGKGKTIFETIDDYAHIVEKDAVKTPKTTVRLLEKVRQSAEAIAASGISRAPCHGDGIASNVMISQTRDVRLVDFDSAGDHDPYFDLGSIIVEIAQFPDLARSVLEIYDGECREAHFNRCMLYGIADDLKWALWGFISFAESPRTHVEFVKYAEWRLLRGLWNAEGPNFDRWIGNL